MASHPYMGRHLTTFAYISKEFLYMNKDIKRGDIFYITDDPNRPAIGAEIWSDRPAIIVSNNVLNRTSKAIQIVYLSTSEKKKPSPTQKGNSYV